MNEDTLKGRRQVHPLESHAAVLRGWALSFRMLGLPYAEPGFATIERAQPPSASASASASPASSPGGRWRGEVHGVLHRLRPADWMRVMATEGVGAGATGYRVVEVEVALYDGRTTRALTLEGQPASLHPGSRAVAPSRRYLELLRRGARHHGLDPEYVSYLDSLQPYDGSGWAPSVGRAAAIAVALPLALPLLPPVLYLRAARKKAQEAAEAAAQPGGGGSSSGGGGGSASATAPAAANGLLAATSAAATAAKYASDLPSKAAAATAAATPLPSAATGGAVAAAESASSSSSPANGSAATAAAAAPSSGGGGGGSVPAELLRPPLALPAGLSGYLAVVQYAVWTVHDVLAAPLLGSGSSNGGSGGGAGGKSAR